MVSNENIIKVKKRRYSYIERREKTKTLEFFFTTKRVHKKDSRLDKD